MLDVNFVLLMILLVIFLVDPWLPVIEKQMRRSDPNPKTGLRQSEPTKQVRKLERIGWICLASSLVAQVAPNLVELGWPDALYFDLSQTQYLTLIYYGGFLFALLMFSTLLIPMHGIWRGIKGRQPTLNDSPLMNGVVRFQSRGWLGLISVAILILFFAFFAMPGM